MKALRWTSAASDDLDALFDFIDETNPKAAPAILAAILRAVEKLREFPRMGRPGRRADTRELVLAKTPFLVWYREQGTQVELLRVVHAKMKWPPRLRR